MFDLFDIFKKLAAIPSASGDESEMRKAIAGLAAPFADEISEDALGNLIVLRRAAKPDGKRLMLSAHMDSIGMIVTHIDDKGFLRFGNLGGLEPALLPGTPVRFSSGARGVIFKDGKADLKDLKLTDLYIDIGASSREEALLKVKVSDTAVYASETCRLGEHGVVSPYADDRIGCAILLLVLEQLSEPENDVYFVFSSQEELGLRGAGTAAFHIAPDAGLAIDVTRTGDIPDPAVKMECSLGAGAAVKIIDSSLVCSPEVVKKLTDLAVRRGIPHQFEVLERGGTDAGAIQRSRGGVLSGAVSIPTRYIHTPAEMFDLRDAEAAVKLTLAFVREFDSRANA